MPSMKDTGRRLIFDSNREGYIARRIEAKTADYTLTAADGGKTFTNRGAAGAVNFTLPTTGEVESGWWAEFYVVANQTVTVTAGTADTMVTFNDAAADSVAFSTASEKIGASLRVIHDGTGWLTEPGTWDDGSAVTTATIAT